MALYYNITCLTGDPAGIKVMENPTKTLKGVLFPRSCLAQFNTLPEASQAGAYILYNTADKNSQPQIYIGQTGYNITSRLSAHNRNRDFWNYALVFVEKGNFLNLNGAHAKIIESILIQKAKTCGVVVMDNATGSNLPRIQDSDLFAAQTWADEVIVMTKLLGLSFFVPFAQTETDAPAKPAPELPRAITPKPKTFAITGLGSFPFDSWVSTTISYCDAIIAKHGENTFANAVIGHLFFGKKPAKRQTFAANEEEMRGFTSHKFSDNLYLLTNYSAGSLQHINDDLSELFPDIQITLSY